MIELIRTLTETYGPSGREQNVRSVIAELIKEAVDEVRTDALGNLIAVKKGSGPRLMLAAHMDEIGLVITHIDEKGFLRFAGVGGISPTTLIGHRVRFESGAYGVIGSEPRESSREEIKLDKLYIDIGARDAKDAAERVKVGDFVTFWRDCVEVGGRVVAKALDDRIGCAVLIESLRRSTAAANEIWAVFTTQEEIGPRGASTSAFSIDPTVAIAVDVTLTGDTPESKPMAVSLGKGPAIKVIDAGMITNPRVREMMVSRAQALGIDYQMEVLEGGTTDALVIQTTRSGIPSGVLSIPCRYVHSPSEMVDLADVENSIKLLSSIISTPLTEV